MATDESALRGELQEVDDLIANVRQSVDGVRQEIGASDGTGDPGDVSALVSSVDEQEAVLSGLEQRRDDLRRRLGLDDGSS